MLEELIKYAKNTKGNIFTLGFSNESKLVQTIQNNKKNINLISLTNKNSGKGKGKAKKKLFSGKTVRVTKIKKFLKHEKIDYTFIEYSSIKRFLKTIIRDSIDITNDTIFFYIDEEVNDIEEIQKRFERYGCIVETIGMKKKYLIKINTKKIKTTKFKNFLFYLLDISYDVQEAIAFVLIGG